MAKRKMTVREQLIAIWGVAKLSFKASPSGVGFKVFGAVLNAILPLVTTFFAALTTTRLAEAYNGNHTAGKQAVLYVFITAGLGLFTTVWSSIDQYIQSTMRYKVEAKVSDIMYEHFLELDFWRYDDKDTADMYDRAKQFSQFFAYVFDRLASILSQFISMVAGLLALLYVSWWLAIILLIAIIPGLYLQFKLSRLQADLWNKNVDVRRARANIEWNLLEPKHIAELRLYGIVKHLLTLRRQLRDKDEKLRLESERSYIPKRLLADAIEAGAELISLLWIVSKIISGAQPIGQFFYVQQVVSRALGGASGLVSTISSIDEDIANLFDYQEFMKLEGAKGGDRILRELPQSIVFEHVSFRYPNTKRDVLSNITLKVEKGQHIAIVGENGAGKSTFVKLLTGLYQPTHGRVALDGTTLAEYSVESWHKQLSVLQQDFIKYRFATARDNVLFGDVEKKFHSDILEESLKKAEAKDVVDGLEKGLDNYVDNWMEDDEGNKGTDLSGGQWQRLALARNFYRDSPLIILDEPTSAIDALAETKIFKRLFADRKHTVVTISHRLTTVERADIIYMFEDGKIAEQGTHKELVKKRGAYYRMFESQLHEDSSAQLDSAG